VCKVPAWPGVKHMPMEMMALEILVQEFTTLDGVIDTQMWMSGYPFGQGT
jgi:hypothetical protein